MAAALAGLLVTTSSCADLAPQNIHMPGTNAGGQPVEIEFDSALNLLPGAQVTINGVPTGTVTDINLGLNAVQVRARLDGNAHITSTSRATLTQATLLGDVFVAITTTPGDSQTARLGDATVFIPRSRTDPQAPLEDTLSVLANYLGTGAMNRFIKAGAGVRKAIEPLSTEIPRVGRTLRSQTQELSESTAELDRILNATAGMSETARKNQDAIVRLLDPSTLVAWQRFTFALGSVVQFIGTIGPFTRDVYWLMPLINSASGAVESATTAGISLWSGAQRLEHFIREFLMPFGLDPRLNVVSVTGPPGAADRSRSIADVLRILGAVP